jgi:lysyl-tRNA synthetase class 2
MDLRLDSTDHRSGLILLGGFLASFLFIRFSTRMMRSPRFPWWPGSVETGGIHVHHMVFGIIGMMVAGFLVIATAPASPWIEILAALFGIGMGLTVDEFALWLYVEDVYWAKEGRASTDAAIVCTALAALVLLGGLDSFKDAFPGVLLIVAESVFWSAIIVAKGKVRLAVIGLLIAPVGWVAAIRLARPNSWWARRRYRPGSRKLVKATERAQRWDVRRDRWLDRIGGAPSLERPSEPPHQP